jgi:hypothetical protein
LTKVIVVKDKHMRIVEPTLALELCLRLTPGLASGLALGLTLIIATASPALPNKQPSKASAGKSSAVGVKASPDSGLATAGQPPEFVKLSQLADKQIHDGQLVKANATAMQILKMAGSEKEGETQCRMLAEVHQIRAEIAILESKWDVAEKELLVVQKISATFAGDDTTGHFEDLLTLIRQKAGKCPAGPRDAADMDREFALKAEMRTLQIAVEDYAREHERKYPSTLADLSHGYMGKFGNRFTNPFSKKEEAPELASNTQIPQEGTIAKGKLFYKSFENGDNYVIYAGGHDGKPLVNEKGDPFVLRAENAPKELPFDPMGQHPHID